MTRRLGWCALLLASQLVLACSSDSATSPTSVAAAAGTASTATTSSAASTTTTTTVPKPTSTTSTTTVPKPTSTSTSTTSTHPPPLITEERVIGQSVQGRDITAYRMGDPTGRAVLLIGVIHGDEAKGYGITQLIRTLPTPSGVDLWIIDSINPDGQFNNTRENANGVDLNRNVSYNWSYIPQSEDNGQYSGEAPADQPETRALEAFVTDIQPNVTIFWHQDAARVSPGGARRVIPNTFAQLVGLSTAGTPCTAGCTGTASQFVNHAVQGGTAFIVELPGDDEVTEEMVELHAEATLEVITL